MWKAGKIAQRTGPPPQACTPALKSDRGMEEDPKRRLELLEQKFFPLPLQASLEDIHAYTYSPPFETGEITQQEMRRALLKPLP